MPILLALYERIEAGELDPHQKLAYDEERHRPGEDLLASFRDGAELSLGKLIHLMIAFSDKHGERLVSGARGRRNGDQRLAFRARV